MWRKVKETVTLNQDEIAKIIYIVQSYESLMNTFLTAKTARPHQEQAKAVWNLLTDEEKD